MKPAEPLVGRNLSRALGMPDCALLVIGAIIGSGIFLTPSSIARTLGNVEVVLLVWAAGGLLTFCGAISYAELGAAYPEAGGIYVFLSKAYGKMTAFLYGWCVFFVIVPGSIATLANAFGIYLGYLVNLEAWLVKTIALSIVAILTIINCLGIRTGAFVQNLLTIIKIGALVAIVSILFFAREVRPAEVETSLPSPFPGWSAVGIAMIAVLWSYDGWHLLTFAAGEVKNPERNLTRGLLLGTLVVIALYLVVNFAYLHVLSLGEIAQSSRVAGEAMERAIGPIGGSLVAIAILISITGAMNGNVLAGPRVPFAMARDRLFFQGIAYVHPGYHVPTVAIVLTGILAGFLTLIGTFEQLFSYVIFVGWIFYGMGAAAVVVLRYKDPKQERPYKAWGYPLVPLVFSISAAAIVLNTLVNDFWNSLWGLAVVLAGLPAYLYWSRNSRLIVTDPDTPEQGGVQSSSRT
jgi:APA family basic amino acid/polyamine antiporter